MLAPRRAQPLERGLDLVRLQVAGDDLTDAPLVDGLGAGRVELRCARVLGVPQQEHDLARLARRERQQDLVRAAWRPAVRYGLAGPSLLDDQRPLPAAVRAE